MNNILSSIFVLIIFVICGLVSVFLGATLAEKQILGKLSVLVIDNRLYSGARGLNYQWYYYPDKKVIQINLNSTPEYGDDIHPWSLVGLRGRGVTKNPNDNFTCETRP